MTYRLYRREPVHAGKWYFTAKCEACEKLVYLLDDESDGKSPPKLVGDGQFSVPCMRCAHENMFSLRDVTLSKSEENLPGARPDREPPSKSSRKPMWIAYPKAKATIGVGYIEDRPKAAAIVARIITAWADIEVQCARLLGELLGTDIPAVAAVFGSLRSSRAQHEALEAAAKTVLSCTDLDLFSAYMSRRASLEKERNDLAHGCFGVAVSIPDHVIWVAQGDLLTFTAKYRVDPTAAEAFRKKQFVYELGTLERIAQEIGEFHAQLGSLIGYLSTRHGGQDKQGFRDQRYLELCNQPHIREALARVEVAKGKPQSASKMAHRKPRPKHNP